MEPNRIKELERIVCVTALVCGVHLGLVVGGSWRASGLKEVRIARAMFERLALERGFSSREIAKFLGGRSIGTQRLQKLVCDYGKGWQGVFRAIKSAYNKQIVYLSGKVSNSFYTHVVEKFRRAEEDLARNGYFVINPTKLVPGAANWDFAMRILVPFLSVCDKICLLPDWEESEGAKLEYEVAKKLGLDVVYYKGG